MASGAWRLAAVLCSALMIVQPVIGPAASAVPSEETAEQVPLDRIPTIERLEREIPDLQTELEGYSASVPGLPTPVSRTLDDLRLVEGVEQLQLPGPLSSPRDGRPALAETRRSGSGITGAGSATVPTTQDDSREEHPPIVVLGNEGPTGFALADDPRGADDVPRPGSGVRSGNGTAENPYVISGWNVSGVRIQDTDAHVVVRDNTIRQPPEVLGSEPGIYVPHTVDEVREDLQAVEEATGWEVGLHLENADNVTVAGNLFVGDDGRIRADHTQDLEIRANDFQQPQRAIEIRRSSQVRISDHSFETPLDIELPNVIGLEVEQMQISSNRFSGGPSNVALVDGEEVKVTANRFEDPGVAVVANGTHQVELEDNDFLGAFDDWRSGIGFAHVGSGSSRLADNRFADLDAGVIAGDETHLSAHANELDDLYIGLLGTSGSSGSATANTFSESFAGAAVLGSGGWVVAANTFSQNLYGAVLLDTGSTLAGNEFGRNVFSTLLGGEGGRVLFNTYEGDSLGPVLVSSQGAHLEGNRLDTSSAGILALRGSNATLVDNRIPSGLYGIILAGHADARLAANSLRGHGILLQPSDPGDARHEIDTSNTVNGEPIRYLHGADGATVEGPAGQVIVASSNATSVRDLTLSNVTVGIQAVDSPGTSVSNATIRDSFYGVWMDESNATRVEDSRILASAGSDLADSLIGVLATDSHDATVQDTRLEGPVYGALTFGADRFQLVNNSIGDGVLGAFVLDSPHMDARSNTLTADIFNVALIGSPHGNLSDNELRNGSLYVSDDDPSAFFGEVPGGYDQRIDESNTVNGDPLRYVAGASNLTVPRPAGQVFVANSSHVRVAHHSIQDTTIPVFVGESDNVTVERAALSGSVPVFADFVENLTVAGNEIDATTFGLLIVGGLSPSIDDNRLRASEGASTAVFGFYTLDLAARNNTVRGFPAGMLLIGWNSTLTANTLVGGGLLMGPLTGHEIDVSNTVNAEPIRYLDGVENATVTEPAGQVLIAESRNVTARGLDVPASSVGVHVADGRNVTVDRVRAGDQPYGIALDDTTDSVVRGAEIRNTTEFGILLDDAARSRVVDNWVVGPDGQQEGPLFFQDTGIYMTSTGITVQGNTVEDHGRGIGAEWGDLFGNASTIVENVVRDNSLGIDTLIAFEQPAIHRNNIHGNAEAGLRGSHFSPTNATHNWWGCPDGPKDPACDGVLGSAITDPWLEEPVEDAGASQTSQSSAGGASEGSSISVLDKVGLTVSHRQPDVRSEPLDSGLACLNVVDAGIPNAEQGWSRSVHVGACPSAGSSAWIFGDLLESMSPFSRETAGELSVRGGSFGR